MHNLHELQNLVFRPNQAGKLYCIHSVHNLQIQCGCCSPSGSRCTLKLRTGAKFRFLPGKNCTMRLAQTLSGHVSSSHRTHTLNTRNFIGLATCDCSSRPVSSPRCLISHAHQGCAQHDVGHIENPRSILGGPTRELGSGVYREWPINASGDRCNFNSQGVFQCSSLFTLSAKSKLRFLQCLLFG